MATMSLRPMMAPLVGVALCVLAVQRPDAALRERPLEHLSARAVSVAYSRPESRIDILIDRWSTDGEWKTARDAMIEGGPPNVLDVLHHLRGRVGVVLMPGVQASGARARQRTPRNLLFAREIPAASGRRLIFVGDQHFGFGESRREARVDRDEFTLLDVRFGADGIGVGKLASTASVKYDVKTQTIEIEDYAARPPRLVDVRVERREGGR